MAAERQREPGDDDAEVHERDEDGEELWPIWRVIQASRLGVLPRPREESLLFKYTTTQWAERVMLIERRDQTAQIEETLARSEEQVASLLFRTREEFRLLASAGMASDDDVQWGRALRAHLEQIKQVRATMRDEVRALTARLQALFREVHDDDDDPHGG